MQQLVQRIASWNIRYAVGAFPSWLSYQIEIVEGKNKKKSHFLRPCTLEEKIILCRKKGYMSSLHKVGKLVQSLLLLYGRATSLRPVVGNSQEPVFAELSMMTLCRLSFYKRYCAASIEQCLQFYRAALIMPRQFLLMLVLLKVTSPLCRTSSSSTESLLAGSHSLGYHTLVLILSIFLHNATLCSYYHVVI